MNFKDYKKGKIIKLKDTIFNVAKYLNSPEALNHRNIRSQQSKFLKLCQEALKRFELDNLSESDRYFFNNYEHLNFNENEVLTTFSSL